MFFSTACSCCGRPGADPCRACVDAMVVLGERDLRDLHPMLSGVYDRCLALVGYDDVVAGLVASFKFRRVRSAVPWIADAMTQRLVAAGERPDIVTWVPASRSRPSPPWLRPGGGARPGRGAPPRRRCPSVAGAPGCPQRDGSRSGAAPRRPPARRLVAAAPARSSGPGWWSSTTSSPGASLAAAGAALDGRSPARLVACALAHRCLAP